MSSEDSEDNVERPATGPDNWRTSESWRKLQRAGKHTV